MTTNAGRRNRHAAAAAFACLALALAAALSAPVTRGAAVHATTTLPRPAIVWKPIPFGARRKAETAAYARRHYGLDTWRLTPRMIVEHVTVSATFASAYWTFHADRADAELHELPGICAHFVVDADGTIYQLVPLGVMCRHTTGLNHVAIGIEHVGLTTAAVTANRRQLRASLALTAWLAGRYRIPLANVIGHNESLEHPLRHELYPGWRCQTHGDFPRAAMDAYRSRLTATFRRARLPVAAPARVDTPCR